MGTLGGGGIYGKIVVFALSVTPDGVPALPKGEPRMSLIFSTDPVEKEQVALWKSSPRNLSFFGCGKVILLYNPPVYKKVLGL